MYMYMYVYVYMHTKLTNLNEYANIHTRAQQQGAAK